MTPPHSPVLEFPVMLHGSTGAILRKVSAKGQEWAREYLLTGAFSQPRRMRQVPPGEVVIVHSGGDFDIIPHPRWRVHLFSDVFMHLDEGVPKGERQGMEDAFESFCLSTPWGALFHAVSPSPPRSARRMARQLAALLRFWDVLKGPRYAFWFDRKYTLEELVEDIYGMTLEAWCPGGAASVRERLALTVERLARASRADCMEAVLRVMPVLVRANADLQHRKVLSDPDFLRERLDALRPEDFESLSSAYRFAVNGQLYVWDRALGRQ